MDKNDITKEVRLVAECIRAGVESFENKNDEALQKRFDLASRKMNESMNKFQEALSDEDSSALARAIYQFNIMCAGGYIDEQPEDVVQKLVDLLTRLDSDYGTGEYSEEAA